MADLTEVIDVYSDTEPRPRQRLYGQRPTVHQRVINTEHDFATPRLEMPVIERPTSWEASLRSQDELVAAAEQLVDLNVGRSWQTVQRAGVPRVCDWLVTFPGESWQERWLASGADESGRTWLDNLTTTKYDRRILQAGMNRLMRLDAIRPGYVWLYGYWNGPFLARLRADRDPEAFARLDAICDATERFTQSDRNFAFNKLARILAHLGGPLADITLDDCVEAYRAEVEYGNRSHGYWYRLLKQIGVLPETAPPTIWAANRRGQLSVAELVDGYDIACRPVRDLFVDYLAERQAELDYSSLRQLVSKLVLLFWRDLEIHEPGICSLHLSDATARAWKERLRHVRYGNHSVGDLREDPNRILMAVRAFYADLAHWALEDPGRWAVFAAPNPITGRDLLGQNKQSHRARARMHERIRELAPVLPALVAAADRERRRTADILAAGRATEPGAFFEAGEERFVAEAHNARATRLRRPGLVYATELEGGTNRNLSAAEQNAFWAWAVIEVLRHTGVRLEELLELTHRSIAAYTLPTTGEVIPLLQITPSKTDRERLLVVGPELAEVLATIISRVRGGHEHLPLVTRYDNAERIHSRPLPFLFQRIWGLSNHTITPAAVGQMIDRTAELAGLTGPSGLPVTFTPHDLRRIFATEAVASGLPVHITAKLLGHETLATTQAYVAVYDREVIEHHQAFIARRRRLRPSEEYREPTEAEWDEFLGHFERRKVELGVCGRAYGTPCEHEHACIRCPMLRPDPAQLPRLLEIIANLHDRLAEAHERGWLGEVDGLEASITAAEQKLEAMRRSSGRESVPIEFRQLTAERVIGCARQVLTQAGLSTKSTEVEE